MDGHQEKRLAIITNTITPYRNPLYSKVNKMLRKEGWSTRVYFMRERETVRLWEVRPSEMDYDFEILKGLHLSAGKSREIHINPSLLGRLIMLNPEVVVIGGYDSISFWVALLYGRLFGKSVVFWNGSTLGNSTMDQTPINWLRRLFIRRCDAFITYGSRAKEFLEYHGAPSETIFQGCNVGDVAYFGANVTESERDQEQRIARILFVGQLIERKGIHDLVDALSRVESTAWHLTILGDGPEREALEETCRNNGIRDKVSFEGFKQKEELLAHYSQADIFALPSHSDPFSIAMSEALASGLFVVASRYDGASADIVEDGVNGYIADPLDPDSLADRLQASISRLHDLPSKKTISNTVSDGMDIYAQQFVDVVKYLKKE